MLRTIPTFTLGRFALWALLLSIGCFAQTSPKTTAKTTKPGATKPAAKPVAKAVAGNANEGKILFNQCQACHATATSEARFGPSLKGLYRRTRMKNGKAPSDTNVLELINKGAGSMPAYGEIFNDKEKRDMIAYLKTL